MPTLVLTGYQLLLRAQWLELFKRPAPRLRKDLLIRILAYRLQEQAYGGLSVANCNRLRRLAQGRQPLDLTFEKLWNVALSRAEQRRRLGFPPTPDR